MTDGTATRTCRQSGSSGYWNGKQPRCACKVVMLNKFCVLNTKQCVCVVNDALNKNYVKHGFKFRLLIVFMNLVK